MDQGRHAAPLTVACVWVRGEVPYTADYVRRLQAMVQRWAGRPYRFVCLTDRPQQLPTGVEARPITPAPGCFAFWNKLRLFDPSIGLSGRVLYIDLDSLIVSDLAAIIDAPASLALTADALVVERAHLDTDRYGRRIIRMYNSSVMAFDAGSHEYLFTRWTPNDAARLSTDQDWIAEQARGAIGLPYGWFPRISRVQPPWPPEAKVVLVKKPKPHEAVQRWPWFDAMWGGWAA